MNCRRHKSHMLGLIALLFAVPAVATTVTRMELSELVTSADSIVQGRVDSTEVRWEENLAYTYISINVDEPLKGERRRAILIRQPGGKIGALNVAISGMPQFRTGDEVIVFLRDRRNGTFDVVGFGQGKYEIVGGFAISNASGLTLLDSKTGQPSIRVLEQRVPIDELKTRIRELIR